MNSASSCADPVDWDGLRAGLRNSGVDVRGISFPCTVNTTTVCYHGRHVVRSPPFSSARLAAMHWFDPAVAASVDGKFYGFDHADESIRSHFKSLDRFDRYTGAVGVLPAGFRHVISSLCESHIDESQKQRDRRIDGYVTCIRNTLFWGSFRLFQRRLQLAAMWRRYGTTAVERRFRSILSAASRARKRRAATKRSLPPPPRRVPEIGRAQFLAVHGAVERCAPPPSTGLARWGQARGVFAHWLGHGSSN